MYYTIPIATSVIRWIRDTHASNLYSGWGVETKKLVTYDETEMAPIWRHHEFCSTYGWEPDNYFTFQLPDTARPWQFVTVSKRKVNILWR